MNYSLYLGKRKSGKSIDACNSRNPHMNISGKSGSGKSYALKRFTAQLPPQGVRCVVFDYSEDFTPASLDLLRRFAGEDAQITTVDVKGDIIINPFQRLSLTAKVQEECSDVASRLAAVLKEIYRFPGDKQFLHLFTSLTEFLEVSPDATELREFIAFVEEDKKRSNHMATSLVRLKSLASLIQCGHNGYDWMLDAPGITILRFDRIPDPISQAILTEFLLADLWNRKLRAGTEACPAVVVLDECQRLRFGERSMLTRILREGRKFDFAGWFASQWIDDKNTLSSLGQAALQIYFCPDSTKLHSQARMLSCGDSRQAAQFEKALARLRVGEFLYLDSQQRPIIGRVDP